MEILKEKKNGHSINIIKINVMDTTKENYTKAEVKTIKTKMVINGFIGGASLGILVIGLMIALKK